MSTPLAPLAKRPIALVAAAAAVVLTALSGRYGFHRDELYFLAAGDRPALGYVDQPPLTPLLAKATTTLFGETPMGLRVIATLAFVAMIVLVGLIARELGAERDGQVLAVAGATISGFVLGIGHMVSTATFDMVAWLGLSWIALRIMRGGDPRWWLAAGAGCGVALLNKYLVVLLIAMLLVSWLIAGPRDRLASWWLLAGVALAAMIAAPNLWWQAAHGWPQLTVATGIGSQDGNANRIMFLPEQILFLSPVLVPIWLAGWRRLWRMSWARAFAVAYPVLCLFLIVVGGKGYYALPLLLVLLAAGPVVAWVRHDHPNRRRVIATTLALGGVASAIVALPVLPASAIGIPNAINTEQGEQIGWPQLTDAVAREWESVDDKSRAVIFTQNYGQAGAIEQYGPALGLPQPYSGHMSYFDWGPPADDHTGEVIVVHQAGAPTAEPFVDCVETATVNNGFGVDNQEQGAVIKRCQPAEAWSSMWPQLRIYY